MADASGTRFLAYEIYSDAAHTRRWGARAGSTVGAIVPASGAIDLAIYARRSSGLALADAYSDTLDR